MREAYDQLEEQSVELEKKKEVCRKRMQRACKHPADEIVEVPHRKGYLGTIPPFRVCKMCGLSEEGWYFRRLGDDEDLPAVSHEYACKFIVGDSLDEDED